MPDLFRVMRGTNSLFKGGCHSILRRRTRLQVSSVGAMTAGDAGPVWGDEGLFSILQRLFQFRNVIPTLELYTQKRLCTGTKLHFSSVGVMAAGDAYLG